MRRLLLPAAAGGVLVVAGVARLVAARRTEPLPPVVVPAPPEPEVVEDEPSEAYRRARRTFNQGTREELHAAARELWTTATLAEKPARWLARDTRDLLALLEERRDLEGLPGDYAAGRAAKLEKRIADAGKRLFGLKPAKVRARIEDA